ncbi:MAG: ribosome biogenesis GTP-binding protein YihA/YsxC [Bacteroidia bacterium]
MKVNSAKYLGSWEKSEEMSNDKLPEFAFIGRSNVGKSSLINMLTNRKELARTSSKPGKTQMLNLYNIDDRVQICDLPGYGYAKVSKAMRRKFQLMIRNYLLYRPKLYCLFVLVDLRIPPQEMDIDFINDCGANQIPIILIGTKADKLKTEEVEASKSDISNELLKVWEEIPPFISSSSNDGLGKDEIWQIIEEAIQN